MTNSDEITISENLLNLFVQTIAEEVSYAKAQPIFQQMSFELSEPESTPQIVTQP